MINSIVFDSFIDWPKLLILWCIHWNEICSIKAIEKVIKLFENKEFILKNWKVTFIPISNPKAFEENKRYIDINLNRIIKKHKSPVLYEEFLANYITDFIDKNDILLDIHSSHSDDEEFVFLDYNTKDNTLLSKACGIKNIIKWWPEIYENTQASDTCKYANDTKKLWVLIECWNHYKKESENVAYNTIINILSYFQMIDKKIYFLEKYNFVTVKKFIIKEKSWNLYKKFNNLDFLKLGDIIALYDDWSFIKAEKDCYIILPFFEANIWDEWFYIWEKN